MEGSDAPGFHSPSTLLASNRSATLYAFNDDYHRIMHSPLWGTFAVGRIGLETFFFSEPNFLVDPVVKLKLSININIHNSKWDEILSKQRVEKHKRKNEDDKFHHRQQEQTIRSPSNHWRGNRGREPRHWRAWDTGYNRGDREGKMPQSCRCGT